MSEPFATKKHWVRHYLVNDQHKFICVPILRCASTSLRSIFVPITRAVHKDEAEELSKTYFTFTIIRFWKSRVLSAFCGTEGLRSGEPFADRVKRYILDWPVCQQNLHVRPQSWWIEGLDVNWIAPLERIKEWWPPPMMNCKLPHLNATSQHKYNDDCTFDWSLLEDIYAEDNRLWIEACYGKVRALKLA